ncbi:IPT/TIG domain-containing protein [Algoriphagus hitonicola]|uniref:IPT/TIG domain-containing protein n=1 Tax=Algoriphagus hitonicola TaxID=435880 RepID=A0A1I2W4F1_9BACT|nr:IPT/TIG domain-containing protein [Algoriphagus hitonicola]SFG96264.1 IPT/TIG domain-containing protein [Algoriphagus hitonicola]
MRKILSVAVLAVFFLGIGCDQEIDETLVVQTEDLLFVSGEQVRASGRVISGQAVSLADHGFYLSEDSDFSNPTVISLGAKDGPGRFIGETAGLKSGANYFIKSFMDLKGEVVFGNVVEFSTLNADLDSFSPDFSVPGEELVILGRNFTSDTQVFFGKNKAEVLEIRLESLIRVRIPTSQERLVTIRVVSQGNDLVFGDQFEYQSGSFELMTEFPEAIRLYENVFFQNSEGFWIGLGLAKGGELISYFQRYQPTTNQWDRINFPGIPRSFAFATEHYLGGGVIEVGRDEFDPEYSFYEITEDGFQRLEDLDFMSRDSKAFEVNGELYLLGSQIGGPPYFRKYNPSSRTWLALPSPPELFNASHVHFIKDQMVYLISSNHALWTYHVQSQTWAEVGQYPGTLGLGYGMGQVIGEKAYVGLYRRSGELWELDLGTLEWEPKNSLPTIPQGVVVGHFQKDDFLYIMRVPDINLQGDFPMEMYRYDPEGI